MEKALVLWLGWSACVAALVLYTLWSRRRVPDNAKTGWLVEIGAFLLALVGAAVAFAGGPIRLGAILVMTGFFVGLVGRFLFTRASNE